MDILALLLPILLIIGLFAALVILKRRLFSEGPTPAPIPIPDITVLDSGAREAASRSAPAANAAVTMPSIDMPADNEADGVSLSPSRLYPCPVLHPEHKTILSRLLKSLPGYVVLPRIAYDHFLEARDGTPSENTSLQNRAALHLADFVICDKRLNVLLVCQVEDGIQVPARIQEREKMLQKAGLRLLRWNVDQPPDSAKLLNTVRTLEKLNTQTVKASG